MQLPERRLRTVAAHLAAAATPMATPVSAAHAPLRAKRGAHARSLQQHPEADDPWHGLSTRDNTPLPTVNSFGVSTVLPGCV